MAVREFNGSSDDISLALDSLASMTFGTYAVIFKTDTVSGDHAIAYHHTSSGAWTGAFLLSHDNSISIFSGGRSDFAALSTGVWFLAVMRKASGTATPRFSVYNFTGVTWSHGDGTSSQGNWGAGGAGGTVRMSFESSGERFDGRIAVMGAWTDEVHWAADTGGDSALEAAGLEDLLSNWVAEAPDALWAFNQTATSTPVVDLVGTSDQVSLTGTIVVTGDDPPGFTFDVDPPPTPIAYKSQDAGAGTETNGATLNVPCPATVDANDILIAHVIHTGTGTAPSTPSGWSLLHGPANVGTTATARHWVFGKLAVGDEDGTNIDFGTAGGTNGRAGRIYSFSGYSSGTLADVVPSASFSAIAHATDPQGPSVTTTVEGALAVACFCQDDNNTGAAIAGMSGGTWTEPVAEYSNATWGPQGIVLYINVCTPTANPGTVSGGAQVATNDESGTIGFEIRSQVPGGATVNGTGVGAYTFTGTASGAPETFGTAAASLSFTGTAAGINRALGVAVAAVTFTGAAAGQIAAVQGLATGVYTFTGAAAGVPETFGVGASNLTFAGAAAGQSETPELAAPRLVIVSAAQAASLRLRQQTWAAFVDLGPPIVTTGVTGAATGAYTFTGTASGIPDIQGAAAASLGFTGTAGGVPDVQGVASLDITFTGDANGFTGTPPVTGEATGTYTFGSTAAGVPNVQGAATGSVAFVAVGSGEVVGVVTGTGLAPFTVTATAIGQRKVVAQAAAVIAFAGTTASYDEAASLTPRVVTVTFSTP